MLSRNELGFNMLKGRLKIVILLKTIGVRFEQRNNFVNNHVLQNQPPYLKKPQDLCI